MDLGHRLFVQSLTRRRRVPGEQSGIALVHRRDLEPGELLDAGRRDALGMRGAEEVEEALEELRREFHDVHRVRTSGRHGSEASWTWKLRRIRWPRVGRPPRSVGGTR